LEGLTNSASWATEADQRLSVTVLFDLIYRLKPLDRQVILLYLEGETAAGITETTGLTARNVATQIHRIKKLLRQWQTQGVSNDTK